MLQFIVHQFCLADTKGAGAFVSQQFGELVYHWGQAPMIHSHLLYNYGQKAKKVSKRFGGSK